MFPYEVSFAREHQTVENLIFHKSSLNETLIIVILTITLIEVNGE